jgi:hypothetical protein
VAEERRSCLPSSHSLTLKSNPLTS